jgi:hypothetical protein
MLKIIIIMIGYILNNFNYSYQNIIIDGGIYIYIYKFQFFKRNSFFERKKLFVLSMWKLTIGYGS